MSSVEKRYTATVEEFFAYLESIPGKAEYFKGEIFDMAGGTKAHGLIQLNIGATLRSMLSNEPCIVYPSDVMVEIAVAEAYFFPDAQIVCNEEITDLQKLSTASPTVIVEVLSESTAAYDRGGKFQTYMKIKSLREYVLIEQETAQVDVFSRSSFEEDWIYKSYSGLGDSFYLPSLNLRIPLAEVYAKVVFPEPKPKPQVR
jgi:Uma2 family endonuclease